MKARLKRLLIKATALSVIVNAVLLYLKFREQGRLISHDYLIAAASFATTLVLIGGIALLYLRLAPHPDDQKKP